MPKRDDIKKILIVGGGTMGRAGKKVDLAHFTLRQMMEMEACTRCGECVAACPHGALRWEQWVRLDPAACDGCGAPFL